MIHPGLAALKHWDKEEYAAGYRARFSEIPPTPKPRIIAGGVDGKTLTQRLLSRLATNRLYLRAGKTILKTLGAISSTQGKRREPTVFLSMKTGRSLGKKVGSRSISTSVC